MNQIEYLSRPLLEDLDFDIDDDHVQIQSSSTVFINSTRLKVLEQMPLLSLYQQVIGTAKAKNIGIFYTYHCKKKILERWEEYEVSCNRANRIFDNIVDQARLVQARGIHYGCRDDEELNKLYEQDHAYSELFWRDGVISQINDIYRHLTDIMCAIEYSSETGLTHFAA